MSRKTGLKTRDVSKDHFSSGKNLNEPKFSRLVVRMLEGAQLLASDISTGKSDPVCFLWLGPCAETPVVEKLASEDHDAMFAKTVVCPTTVDPIWNEDVVFELQVSDVNTMMDQKCVIFIRDEDIEEDGSKSYDELGMVEFSLKEIVSRGRALKSSIVLPATWYTLKKSPGMRRIDGRVKLTISLIFTPEDIETINDQLPPLASSDGIPSYAAGVGPLIQSHFKDPALVVSDPADMRVSTASSLRQSLSASGRRGTSTSPQRGSSDNMSVVSGMSSRAGGPKRPKSAHIVRRKETPSSLPDLNQDVDSDADDRNTRGRSRRPQSAPNRRYDIIQEEDEDDAGGEADAQKNNGNGEGGADDEDEQELLVIPSKKAASNATDELLAAPPAPGDQNFFAEIIGNAVSDGLGELAAFGAENVIDHAGDALNFAARKLGKGLKKVASAVTEGGSQIPSVSTTKAVGQRLATLSKDDSVRKALDMVDVPSVDLNDKTPQGGRGGITLLRGAGAGGAAAATKGGRPTDTSTPRSVDSGATPGNRSATGASQAKGNALFGENPLVARLRANSNGSGTKNSSPHDDGHDEHAAYDRYRNIHQQHGDLLSQYGLVAPMGDRDAAPGDEEGDKDDTAAAAAKSSTDASDQRATGESSTEAAGQATADDAAAAAVEEVDAGAGQTAKSNANASAVVLPSRGSKQTESNGALSAVTDDAALLAGLDDGVQGNATAVVRLLREMKLQREEMQQGMMSLARATEAGFRTLTQRIQHLEDVQGTDKPSSSSSSSRHAKRLLENGPSGGDEGGNEVLSDLEEDVTDTNRRRPTSSSAKGGGRGAKALHKTAPASTHAASGDKGSSSGAANWKKAKTGTASVSQFRQFRRQQQQQQLYTPVGGGSEIPLRSSINGTGASNAGPTIQMVYRDASGAIAAAPVAAPAAPTVSSLPLLDSSNAAAGATYGAQPPLSPVRFSYDNAPLGNLGASHTGLVGGPSLPPPINASLNRDFVEVLDKGSLEDVARLLESSAAKPEMLAISTRNRVYDIVATLLLQRKQYTERALIWVTALLRPNSSSTGTSSAFRELTPHTQRDLLQAVHHASTEPSKRGVLASLLYNQIDRAMSMG